VTPEFASRKRSLEDYVRVIIISESHMDRMRNKYLVKLPYLGRSGRLVTMFVNKRSRYSDWLRAGRPRCRSSNSDNVKNLLFFTSPISALQPTQPLYPQEDSWYSFLLEAEPTTVRLEALSQLKSPVTSSKIERATFRLVA
jgi:hypothetical protein